MRRLPFLTRLLPLTLTALPCLLAAQPTHNVLFIAIDDLGNVLGRTRPLGLDTPHLDRLTQRGIFFERAYCQIPLCNPTRASVLTGQRPDAIGVYDLDRHFRDQRPNLITLPQLFRQHGGFAARVGKIYHYDVPNGIGTDGLDDPDSWDAVVNPKGRDVTDEALITNPLPDRPISAAMSWLAAAGTDGEQTDGMIARQAVALLHQYAATPAQPFFLGVGFFRPHTPYVAPQAYFDAQPLDQVQLTPVPADDAADIPKAAIPHNIPLPDYGHPEPILRQALHAYLASVRFVDAQVGLVLNALDTLHLWPTTVVVLWSDHGYHLGEHHLWQKRTLFDESARAPLIIAAPQIPDTSRNHTCQRVVEFIDLYPTISALAGLTPTSPLPGRSLLPLLILPTTPWPHPAFTQILRPSNPQVMGRAITTERWRYIEWNEGTDGRELYDHQNDPRELTNLATDPHHQKRIDALRSQFDGIARGTPPPPSIPVNPARL